MFNFESLKPGEIVLFGAYPQAADAAHKTPISWRVLRNSDGELLLLSEHILDCKRYHGEFVDTSWSDCDLRRWLNEKFYNAAFNDAEKQRIVTTLCADNGEKCPDTRDNVFLLGTNEVKNFTASLSEDAKTARRAAGTDWAKIKKPDGCRLYVYDKGVEADYLSENGQKQGCSWWWLRTQTHESLARASFVGPRASVRSYGRVNLACYGVRPALKLRLERDFIETNGNLPNWELL